MICKTELVHVRGQWRELTLTEHRKNGENQYKVKFEEGFASKSTTFVSEECIGSAWVFEGISHHFSGGRLMDTFLSH